MTQAEQEELKIPERMPDIDPHEENIMKKYIGIDVPAYGCNLRCSYCYVEGKRSDRDAFPKLNHSPRYIRWRLRRDVIGGSALIGICASGETLFADKLSELCVELLKEGHYIILVTNALYTKGIRSILDSVGEYASHLIFKASLHYLELKERHLLKQFADNIKMIDESKASFTIELMPHDELVAYIPEILDFSKNNFGAYPQLTVGRDEENARKLLTRMEKGEYIKTWSVFGSEMFDLKIKYYMMHGTNCYAGKDSYFIELDSGNMRRCLFADDLGNFYDDSVSLEFTRVKDMCPLDYCYNCHAYVTIGVLPDFPAPTLTEIRDRIRENGQHWLKRDARRFMNVKLHKSSQEEYGKRDD